MTQANPEYKITITEQGEYIVNIGEYISGVGFSNLGTGAEVLNDASAAADIQFRTLTNTDGDIVITQNANDISINLADDLEFDDLVLTGNVTLTGADSTVTAPNLNFSGTLTAPDLDDVLTIDAAAAQNLTITVDDGNYLHANVSDLYAGSLTQAAHITSTEIKHIGERLSITGELLGAVEFEAKNTSGTDISVGDAVYISGHSGNDPEIGVANEITAMPSFGLAAQDIAPNAKGKIVTFGELRGFNTSAVDVGDELYVNGSPSPDAGVVGSNVANERPTAANTKVQKVGKVIRSHATNGIIFVMGAGRTNDIPNAFSQDVVPSVNSFYDLGSETNRFAEVHSTVFDAGTTRLASGGLTTDTGSSLTLNAADGTENIYSTGSLVPSADNTYDLGSESTKWRSLYLSGGSLYIEGQKVVGSTDGSIDFTTDDNENMTIFAGGSGSEGTMTIGSAGLVTNIQDTTVNLGPAGGAGNTNVRNTLQASTFHNGDLEFSGTLINQTATGQNLEIRTNGAGYLHANVADLYVGPLSGAVKIDENSISATAGTLTVTGNLTGNVTGDLTGDVTGNLTGNVTGDVTGDLSGDLTKLSGTQSFSIRPFNDNAVELGTADKSWTDLYIGEDTRLTNAKLLTTSSNLTIEAGGSGYISLYGDSVNVGDVGGTGWLGISGSTGALSANGSYTKLILDDDTDVDGLLKVYGVATFLDDVDISGVNGTLNVDSTTTLNDDVTVNGANARKTVIGDSQIAGSYDTHGFKVFADDTAWGSVTIQEYVGGADKPAASGFANPTFGTEIIGGTPTAKSNVVSGKRLFNLQALASNATDGSLPTTSNFLMKVETTEDQTASARGTKLAIETMANGSTSRATTLVLQDDTITVNPDGDGKIETGGTLILNDAVNVTGTLDAQSTIINSTGNVQVNDNLDVTGNLTVDGAVTLGDANTDAITVNGPLTCVNGLVLTSMNTSTANYLAGTLGIIDEGAIAYITDGDSGSKCIAVYDGSNWKRISFGANISST